ncbi:MAG: signal peptidase II [Candidatus Methylomirabilia bacterium]
MLAVGLGLAVLVLDQATKALALARLPLGSPVPVVDGFMAFTLVLNPGLAFGILSSAASPKWLAALLSFGALSVLVFLASHLLSTGGRLPALALGLIFGGAVGNLIDRGRFGAVVDFIDLFWRDYHWPAFNVADSAITVGVGLLALRLLVSPRST